MGGAASRTDADAAAAAAPAASGSGGGSFTVRMTPALRSVADDSSAQVPMSDERNQLFQEAFRQGVEYAQQQLQLEQEHQLAAIRQEQLSVVQDEAARKEEALAASIEALHKREYRAPIQPMGCQAEREAVLTCYRSNQKAQPGDLVFACEQDVRKLDECANILRLAAMSKIVPGSLAEQ